MFSSLMTSQEMGSTVCLTHLQTNREALLGRKVARLSQGSNIFSEGRASFVLGGLHHSTPFKYDSTDPDYLEVKASNEDTDSSSEARSHSADLPKSRESHTSVSISTVKSQSRYPQTMSERETLAAFVGENGQQLRNRLVNISKSDVEARAWTMTRAANIIRECLDLDSEGGAVFFDANHDFICYSEADDDAGFTSSDDQEAASVALSNIAQLGPSVFHKHDEGSYG